MRSKLTDVAAKAGVSVTTVSRVINNYGYLSQATKDKVFQAMKELNYQPKLSAKFFSPFLAWQKSTLDRRYFPFDH